MPIYEYRCDECEKKFELFVRSMSKQNSSACPECGSQQVRKDISLFGVGSASVSKMSAAACAPGSL